MLPVVRETVAESQPKSAGFSDPCVSLDAWQKLLGELLHPGSSVVVIAEMSDGTSSLSSGVGKKKARAVKLLVRGGSAWRVSCKPDEAMEEVVISFEERKSLIRSVFEEVPEVICWRAKEVLVSLQISAQRCAGLVDPQIGLWLLNTDETTHFEEALRRFEISKTDRLFCDEKGQIFSFLKKLFQSWPSVGTFIQGSEAEFGSKRIACSFHSTRDATCSCSCRSGNLWSSV